MIKRITITIIFVLSGLTAPLQSSGSAQQESPSAPLLSITVHEGGDLISVAAQDIPVGQLLSALTRRTGIEISGRAVPDAPISFSCRALPPDEALAAILRRRGISFAFAYRKGRPDRLEKVVLLGDNRHADRAALDAGDRKTDGGEALSASDVPAKILPEGAEEFRPDLPLEDLIAWAGNADPRMRAAALEALSLHRQDERARDILTAGVRDPDPSVRLVAVGLLEGEMKQWPEAEEAIMSALSDPLARVRQTALMMLWESASPRVAEALKIAMNDTDPAVREEAEDFLGN